MYQGLAVKNKRNNKKERKMKNTEVQEKGITLIALVITIVVLLILARSSNSNANRRKWHINKCYKCK